MVLLNTLIGMWSTFQNTFTGILDFMSLTLNEMLTTGNENVDNILRSLLNALNLGDFSLIEFMLGGGLAVLICVSVAKWAIGIIT